MKKIVMFFQIIFVLIFISSLNTAQVSNLKVNGSSSSFTVTSGDSLSWSYNLSVGGTSNAEIWVDATQLAETIFVRLILHLKAQFEKFHLYQYQHNAHFHN